MSLNNACGLFSFTCEGFLNILELSWNKMTRLDTRIARQLPYPVYVLCMDQLMLAQMLRISDATRQQATWGSRIQGQDAYHMVGGESAAIPIEVYEWIQGLGSWTDPSGYPYNVNVPEILIPKPYRIVNRVNVPGGDFGLPAAANHNIYETMIAPIVLRKQIEACLANVQADGLIDYEPLPDQLTPADLVVNENFLGYEENIAPWHRETLGLYANANAAWPQVSGLASRLCFNPALWAKCDAALNSLSQKMQIVNGLPPIDNGLLAASASITNRDDGELTTILRRSDGTLTSTHNLDPSSLAQAAMFTYRRYRTMEAPGLCYLNVDNTAPNGWLNTINSSYNMNAPFNSAYQDPDQALDIVRFRRTLAHGRFVTIGNELYRRTIK